MWNSDAFLENGDHIRITKGWVKSSLQCINCVKRKDLNVGKTTPSQFSDLKVVFLADIQAEVMKFLLVSSLIEIKKVYS